MTWKSLLALLQRVQSYRWFRIVLNIVLVLILVAFVGRYVLTDWQQLSKVGVRLDWGSIGIALILYGASFVLSSMAWQGIITRFGGPVSWLQNASFFAYTYLAKFLPTPAWFVAGRISLYKSAGMEWRAIVTTTTVEILLQAASGLALFGLLAADLSRPVTWLYLLALVPAAVSIARPRWLELPWLNREKVIPGLRPRDVVTGLVLYAATWLLAGPFMALCIKAIGQPVLLDLPGLWRIWIVTNLIAYVATYTLGGIAVLREFTLTWYLSGLYSPPVALLVAVDTRLAMTVGGVLWAAAALLVSRILLRSSERNLELEEQSGP